MRKLFWGFAAALCVVLTSCATIQPISTEAASPDRHVERNYAIGVQQSVFVGEAIIRVKDYYTIPTGQILRPDKDFTLKFPPFLRTDVAAGSAIEVMGTTVIDGTTLRVARLPDPKMAFLRCLVTDDGLFYPDAALNDRGARIGIRCHPRPANVKLLSDAPLNVAAGRGFTNFELIYGGTTGDEIHLMYREYTPDDMARPAFSQQLVYSLNSRSIRFRAIQIDVATADNQQITYTVIADGQ